MHPILRRLRQEHQQYAQLILRMNQLLAERRIDLDTMHLIGRYLFDSVVHYHEPKEAALIAMMRRNSMLNVRVDHVAGEHERLRVELTTFLGNIALALEDSLGDAQFRSYCRRTLQTLSDHMTDEEKHLFPLAEKRLSDAQWIELRRCVGRASDPLFGHAAAERYDDMHRNVVGLTKLAESAMS